MCTAALAFDGVLFNGAQLKIKRPNDYVPAPVTVRGAGSAAVVCVCIPLRCILLRACSSVNTHTADTPDHLRHP
jgi:hypothetical protein